MTGTGRGTVIICNGAPRSGKSSIAAAIQAMGPNPTINLGVDLVMAATPPQLRPGIGLRPGGERPDLEPFVLASYRALFDSIAAHAAQGLDVVADLGIHDDYAEPLGIWSEAARRLEAIRTYVVGVRCSVDVILERRAAHPDRYATGTGGEVPAPVLRWEHAVHDPGWYDLEVDTTDLGSDQCASLVLDGLAVAVPEALERHRPS